MRLLLLACALALLSLQGGRVEVVRGTAQDRIAEIKADKTDFREVLRAVFKEFGRSYSIAPEVQGVVTVDLKNVSLEGGLRQILDPLGATYRYKAGVYQIVLNERSDLTAPSAGYVEKVLIFLPGQKLVEETDIQALKAVGLNCEPGINDWLVKDSHGPIARVRGRRVRIVSDPAWMARVILGIDEVAEDEHFIYGRKDDDLVKLDGSKVVTRCPLLGPGGPPGLSHIVFKRGEGEQLANVDLLHADVRQAIAELFDLFGRTCKLNSDVKGRVTLKLNSVSFDEALADILIQVGGMYRSQTPYIVEPRDLARSTRNTMEVLPLSPGGTIPFDRFAAAFREHRIDKGYLVVGSGPQTYVCQPEYRDRIPMAVTQDDEFLYLNVGWTIRVRKSDFKIVP